MTPTRIPGGRADWAARPRDLAALVLLVLGIIAATLAAGNAARFGEPPQTVLPFARSVAAYGLPALGTYRLLVTLAIWGLLARRWPRYRAGLLALGALWWFVWAVWQAWVLLALT